MKQPLSVIVTTFNNEATLERCLQSVRFAEEIVVLDSFSTDRTIPIAERFGAVITQQEFAGYGPQKAAAMGLATHDWILLLDADEALGESAQREIAAELENPRAVGYSLPRIEQMFWRWQSAATRANRFLRLFQRAHATIDDLPIHAAPKVDGETVALRSPFYHFGETSIHVKVDKINHYSSGLVTTKRRSTMAALATMLIYPPLFFARTWIFKRHFLNGWAGFIHSVVAAFYVFLKYAKVFESRQRSRVDSNLP